MANNQILKDTIAQAIKTNGQGDITATVLRTQLNNMIDTLGASYKFAGVVEPDDAPGTHDDNVFFLATVAGTYTDFGGLTVSEGELAILIYDGSWTKQAVTINAELVVGTFTPITLLGAQNYYVSDISATDIKRAIYYGKQVLINSCDGIFYVSSVSDNAVYLHCIQSYGNYIEVYSSADDEYTFLISKEAQLLTSESREILSILGYTLRYGVLYAGIWKPIQNPLYNTQGLRVGDIITSARQSFLLRYEEDGEYHEVSVKSSKLPFYVEHPFTEISISGPEGDHDFNISFTVAGNITHMQVEQDEQLAATEKVTSEALLSLQNDRIAALERQVSTLQTQVDALLALALTDQPVSLGMMSNPNAEE